MANTQAKDTFIRRIPRIPIDDDEDLYPAEDGKPMAASDYHRELLFWTWQALKEHFEQVPKVYTSGDIMVYYKEGDPEKSISPDVLVCFGIDPGPRRTYRVWKEGKVPDFVMEFSSENTYAEDLGEKMDVYGSLGIQEYFLYDALGLYLPDPLMCFTLVDGVYVAIQPGEQGGFRASTLDLDFHIHNSEIRIYDPVAGEWLQTRADRATTPEEHAVSRARNAKFRAERFREEIARLKARS